MSTSKRVSTKTTTANSRKRKKRNVNVTMTSETRPIQGEQDLTMKPSERVVANNSMTVNKRAGSNKNRHLFVLPGLLQAHVLQNQIVRKKKKKKIIMIITIVTVLLIHKQLIMKISYYRKLVY